MSRTFKLASTAIAIAVSAALGGSVAYGSGATPAPSRVSSAAGPSTTTTLVIEHVRQGCHAWRKGTLRSASMHLGLTRRSRLQVGLEPSSLRTGLGQDARLRILNRDIVAHQLVQVAGPPLDLRGHMMAGTSQLITFSRPGVYHFTERVVKMGGPAKVMTIGPDNMLHLAVSVR